MQYVVDTLCIGKTTINHLWVVNVLFRGFEMVLKFVIDFFSFKSSLIGVNIPSDFMTMACTFFGYSKGSLPFKYLDLSVGENPRHMC